MRQDEQRQSENLRELIKQAKKLEMQRKLVKQLLQARKEYDE
jgi:hypothetical protein